MKLIDPLRFKECCDILSIHLNPIKQDELYEMEGQKINLHQLIPMIFSHIQKISLKNEEKAEEIFTYMVESIHYFTGITDERPEVVYQDPKDEMLNNSGYADSEVRVIAKKKK